MLHKSAITELKENPCLHEEKWKTEKYTNSNNILHEKTICTKCGRMLKDLVQYSGQIEAHEIISDTVYHAFYTKRGRFELLKLLLAESGIKAPKSWKHSLAYPGDVG